MSVERRERRCVTINGKEYSVVGVVKSTKIDARVFDLDESEPNSDPIVSMTERRTKWLGFRERDHHKSLPDVMQGALSSAVESVENERMESEEIDERIENIKETYEQ